MHSGYLLYYRLVFLEMLLEGSQPREAEDTVVSHTWTVASTSSASSAIDILLQPCVCYSVDSAGTLFITHILSLHWAAVQPMEFDKVTKTCISLFIISVLLTWQPLMFSLSPRFSLSSMSYSQPCSLSPLKITSLIFSNVFKVLFTQ